jgi:hypothetical protein
VACANTHAFDENTYTTCSENTHTAAAKSADLSCNERTHATAEAQYRCAHSKATHATHGEATRTASCSATGCAAAQRRTCAARSDGLFRRFGCACLGGETSLADR